MSIINGSLQVAGGDNSFFTAHATAVPLERQIVFNTQTGQFKIGDGTTQLQNLTYNVIGVSGSGKYVLQTAPTVLTSLNLDYSTASRLAATDSSKNLISLDTATYPSLFELAFIKGLTSAIQAQLDSKYLRVTCSHGDSVQFASGATLYWSTWHFTASSLRSTAGQSLTSLPVNATLVAAVITTFTANGGTTQTGATVNFRYNGSDNAISSNVLWSASANTPVVQVVTGLSVSTVAGTTWEIKIVLPTLATAPSNAAHCTVDLYFKL